MSLVDLSRAIERVMSDKTDEEIQLYIDMAMADMRRVGVRESLLDPENLTPLAKGAAIFYVEANYGHDNSEHDKWHARYMETVASLMNSSANECDKTVQVTQSDSADGDEEP